MMGFRTDSSKRLFDSFNLEDHIPLNHPLRGINQCLDLSELRNHLADFHSHTGRPSIDPELMIRMVIVGYSYGIRSERRLCEELHLNLAYRWFCRLGLEDGGATFLQLQRMSMRLCKRRSCCGILASTASRSTLYSMACIRVGPPRLCGG
jgi:transposase